MKVKILERADTGVGKSKRALFAGQVYDLAPAEVRQLIGDGLAEAVGKARKPAEDKAVSGPPEDKGGAGTEAEEEPAAETQGESGEPE